MLTVEFHSKCPEFKPTAGTSWHTFTMAGTHTMQVCVPGHSIQVAEQLAELLYQPADLPLNIRAALYMPLLKSFTVLTGNQVVVYRGTVCFTNTQILVNTGKLTDCFVFSPASGFINAFSLARQFKQDDALNKLYKHIANRRTQ